MLRSPQAQAPLPVPQAQALQVRRVPLVQALPPVRRVPLVQALPVQRVLRILPRRRPRRVRQ